MKKSTVGTSLLVLLVFATLTYCLDARREACQPNGKIRGIKPPPGQCNPEHDSDCCKQGKMYTFVANKIDDNHQALLTFMDQFKNNYFLCSLAFIIHHKVYLISKIYG